MRTAGLGTPIRGTGMASSRWTDPVKDKDLTAPPGSPGLGDRYIIAAGGSGLWSGRDNDIAEWAGTVWLFTTPTLGLTTYVEDEMEYYSWNGSAWVQESFGPHAPTHKGGGTDEVDAATDTVNGLMASVDKAKLDNVTMAGFVDGARLAWVSASQVSIGTAGQASKVIDSLNGFLITWSGALIADITVSGAGGLDTGSEAADTWYAVHAIEDSNGVNPPKAMLSLSPTAPTMPGGYDKFRRLGWVRNDGSNFQQFYQIGTGRTRHTRWETGLNALRVLNGGSATSWTDVDASSGVSPTAQRVLLSLDFQTGGGGSATDHATFRRKGFGGSGAEKYRAGLLSSTGMRSPYDMIVDTSQTFQYLLSNAANSLTVRVLAYDEEL